MLNWLSTPAITPPADMRPTLLVIIDTEEEFDWTRPVSRDSRDVTSIAAQFRAQEIFARYGVVPTYVIDHPVASTPSAIGHLREFADDGRCEIGAHLHPWVCPPDDEDVTTRNSYPGNLPPSLERAKLACLTDTIEAAFGRTPTVYKAGRYGIGPDTADTLEALGYDVDISAVPYTDFSADGGPDFTDLDDGLRWFGKSRKMLEIPLSVGFAGVAAGLGPSVYPLTTGDAGRKLHIPGVFARTGVLERIRLSPEGVDFAAHKRLTRSLLKQGQRVFSYTYHSPSLEPGHTPYVRSERDLAIFLDRIDSYCDWFVNEIGGRASTPAQLFAELSHWVKRPAAA